MHVEIREQLFGVGSLLLPLGSKSGNYVVKQALVSAESSLWLRNDPSDGILLST